MSDLCAPSATVNSSDLQETLMARELITGVHMKLFTLAALLTSSLAFAAAPQKLNVLLGHHTTLSLHTEVSKVSVSDPSKVEIKKQGRRVTLVGLEKGTTEATIRTREGVTKMSIYVAADKYAMPY